MPRLPALLALLIAAPAFAEPPKVLLVGDSIRLGYAPTVVKALDGVATVVSPKDNGGDTANVLTHLDAWLKDAKPAVVHFNCGLHDLKQKKESKAYQVPLAEYEKNLEAIVGKCRAVPGCVVLFATTTPIDDAKHGKRKADFDRHEADVERYNVAARKVMERLNVPVTDLHAVVVKAGADKVQGNDGTHYSADGSKRLGEAVAAAVKAKLPATAGP